MLFEHYLFVHLHLNSFRITCLRCRRRITDRKLPAVRFSLLTDYFYNFKTFKYITITNTFVVYNSENYILGFILGIFQTLNHIVVTYRNLCINLPPPPLISPPFLEEKNLFLSLPPPVGRTDPLSHTE